MTPRPRTSHLLHLLACLLALFAGIGAPAACLIGVGAGEEERCERFEESAEQALALVQTERACARPTRSEVAIALAPPRTPAAAPPRLTGALPRAGWHCPLRL